MIKAIPPIAAPLLLVLLLTVSCGATVDGAASSTAEANLEQLERADDIRDFEVLNVVDGSITTLRDEVDGDRPVLLWFWAPH